MTTYFYNDVVNPNTLQTTKFILFFYLNNKTFIISIFMQKSLNHIQKLTES